MKQVYNPKHYDNLLDHIRACASKTQRQAVAYLEGNVVEYLNKKIEKASGAEKKFFEKTHNLVTSYRDGLQNGDIEVRELRALRSDMVKTKAEYEQKLVQAAAQAEAKRRKEAERAGVKVEVAAPTGKKDDNFTAPDWFDEWVKNGEEEGFDHGEDAARVMRKYAKFRKELPKRTNKPYVSVRVPVVAVPKAGSIPNEAKLARSGLCEDTLFGYPVIKNQVLIGLSNEWLMENYSQKVKNSQSLMKDPEKDKDFKLDYAKALDKILEDIKIKTGRRFLFLGSVHAFHSVDLHWAWAISEMDMKRLEGTLSGLTTFSIQDWTLPFPDTIQKLRPRSVRR